MHYLFRELKDEGVIVEWNLFQDKHGMFKLIHLDFLSSLDHLNLLEPNR
jgi:hypothetical protein